MNEGERIFIMLYEPRWHGFARWSLERREPADAGVWIKEVARGWWRPPKGWKLQTVEVTDYNGIGLKWMHGRLIALEVVA